VFEVVVLVVVVFVVEVEVDVEVFVLEDPGPQTHQGHFFVVVEVLVVGVVFERLLLFRNSNSVNSTGGGVVFEAFTSMLRNE
jgi:hypothetical protein